MMRTSSPSRPRTVLVVDDHPLFRAGFVSAWRRWRAADRVIEAGSLRAAADQIGARTFDVAIVDLRLPDGSGLDLCKELVARSVDLVVMLTTYDGVAIVDASRRLGVRGFLSKEMPVGVLFFEIDRLLKDERALSYPPSSDLPRLTARELETLRWLLYGRTNPEMARLMGVSVETVKTHVSAVLGRLGASDRFEAVEIARRLGFDVSLPHMGEV